MHVVVGGLARHLLRGGEQRPDVNVKPDVRERGCDDLLAAVVAVLPHLCDKDSGPPAVSLGEFLDDGGSFGKRRDVSFPSDFVAVDAGNGTDFGLMAPVYLLKRVGDLPDGGLGPRGVDW